jgi:cytochrome c553
MKIAFRRTKMVEWAVLVSASVLAVACSSSSGKGGAGGSAGSRAGAGGSGGSGGATVAALQARGKYIIDHVAACGDCHTPMGMDGKPIQTMYLAGNPDFIVLPNGQKLGTRNLTNDETGLKNRTDAEIKDMFQNGTRPTATGMEPLNPVMPYYVFHNMSDEDANAIVAYLRTVPAVTHDIPRRGTAFDVPAAAPPVPVASIPMPVATWPDQASALRGRYLAGQIGVCMECHTQHLAPGAATVLDETKLFAGGEDFSALFAATLHIMPVSKNLTSDSETGLGKWTVDDVGNVLKQGKAKDGTGICPPMPVGPNGAFGGLTDGDVTDIANYIKSLPPVTNMIVDMCVFPPMGGGGGAGGGAPGGSGGGAGGAAGGGSGGAAGGSAGGVGGAGGA